MFKIDRIIIKIYTSSKRAKTKNLSSSNDKIRRTCKNSDVCTEGLIVLLVNFVIHVITFLLHETKNEHSFLFRWLHFNHKPLVVHKKGQVCFINYILSPLFELTMSDVQQCIDLSAQMSKLAHYNPYIITVLCAYEIILIPKDFE